MLWNDRRGPPMWVRATARPVEHPCRVVQFGIAGFRRPPGLFIAPGSNVSRGPSDRSGAIGEPEQGSMTLPAHAPGDVELIAGARSEACSRHGPARSRASDHAHTNAPQPWDCLGLRMTRDLSEILTHSERCGWRAAQASMAHDMPRSSCCPAGTYRRSRSRASRFQGSQAVQKRDGSSVHQQI